MKHTMSDNELKRRIEQNIYQSALQGWITDEGGIRRTMPCISFREYMNSCLYDEMYGYYRSGAVRIGKEGDFYTSSAVGSVMARSLAAYAVNYRRELGDPPFQLVEWGAGTGRLSTQLVSACRSFDAEWAHQVSHVLVDDNPVHREAAAAAAELQLVEAGARQISILSSPQAWAVDEWSGWSMVLANELLDAFPVHRVQLYGGELVELGVACNEVNGFRYVRMSLTDQRIEQSLAGCGIKLREGQITEVNLNAEAWLGKLGRQLKRGRLVVIDYGHEAQEYASEHRMNGTLLCYRKHQASDNPLLFPGEQDITSHVNYTQIRDAAERQGWRTVYYATQKQFLIDNGIMEVLQQHDGRDPFSAEARMNRAVRQLLLSDQMSEAFKVLVLEK